jgi:hypothetical protein
MDEGEFKQRHPGVERRFGKSSEDDTWWADVRRDGRFIAALSRSSLSRVLDELDVICTERMDFIHFTDGPGVRGRPFLPGEIPDEVVTYGLGPEWESNQVDDDKQPPD